MDLSQNKMDNPSKINKGDLTKATNNQLIELLDTAKDRNHLPSAISGIIQDRIMKTAKILFC